MYYEADAKIMSDLRDEIENLGVPLMLLRKFNLIVSAITVQIEDENASLRVVDTLFNALVQLCEAIRQPEREMLLALTAIVRRDITQRLQKRDRPRGPADPLTHAWIDAQKVTRNGLQ
jgi:hypothetical protein